MMYFGIINGPVEGVLIGSILMLVSGLVGPSWWHTALGSLLSSPWIPEWAQLTDLILFPMIALMLGLHVPLWWVAHLLDQHRFLTELRTSSPIFSSTKYPESV